MVYQTLLFSSLQRAHRQKTKGEASARAGGFGTSKGGSVKDGPNGGQDFSKGSTAGSVRLSSSSLKGNSLSGNSLSNRASSGIPPEAGKTKRQSGQYRFRTAVHREH